MKLKRPLATIAAGLLTGAAALGFGLGTAEADPVDWVAGVETNVSLDMGDGLESQDLPRGTFTGEVDEDASSITGEAEHPTFSIDVDAGPPLGDVDLNLQLTITDIDLTWDQDDDTVAGSAVLQLNLLNALGGAADLSPCVATAPAEVAGTYDGETLVFGGEIGSISLEGECGGDLKDIVEGAIADLTGSFKTTVSGEAPGETEEPEETTTTTEAPAEETPENGGATPIPQAPSYTG